MRFASEGSDFDKSFCDTGTEDNETDSSAQLKWERPYCDWNVIKTSGRRQNLVWWLLVFLVCASMYFLHHSQNIFALDTGHALKAIWTHIFVVGGSGKSKRILKSTMFMMFTASTTGKPIRQPFVLHRALSIGSRMKKKGIQLNLIFSYLNTSWCCVQVPPWIVRFINHFWLGPLKPLHVHSPSSSYHRAPHAFYLQIPSTCWQREENLRCGCLSHHTCGLPHQTARVAWHMWAKTSCEHMSEHSSSVTVWKKTSDYTQTHQNSWPCVPKLTQNYLETVCQTEWQIFSLLYFW